MGRIYPRSSLRKIIKSGSGNRNMGKRVDLIVYLNYILFLEELLKQANIEARQAGDKMISQRHIDKVTEKTLSKFKG
ncbi:hypothetical protein V1514DRAFT_334160 [Lipomyces japonicus]|uniref:uncharacterized protein n=1 Tax=Lipomyces japonicus TaxID=56871 RepID=UPI0034CEC502